MTTAMTEDNIWNGHTHRCLNNPHIQDSRKVKTVVNSWFRSEKDLKILFSFVLFVYQRKVPRSDPKRSNLKEN